MRWGLDGVSFVLGEKRAKTARELFPDAPDIKAPLLFFLFLFFYFRWVSLKTPSHQRLTPLMLTTTHSLSPSLCSHVVSGVHEEPRIRDREGTVLGSSRRHNILETSSQAVEKKRFV